MKRPPLTTHSSPLTRSPRRGGAVIVVVLTLLSSLAFLGFFYYSWSKTAVSTAQNFALRTDHSIDPDAPFDVLYQQVIVSTPDAYPNSALQSGQVTVAPGDVRRLSLHSLLAHTIGIVDADGRAVDLGPHTGRGIGVFATADNNADGLPDANTGAQIVFDYNNDGTPDADGTGAGALPAFRINFSPLTNGGGYFNFDTVGNDVFLFTPDAGYTYPDINSPFLAHDALVPVLDASGSLTSIERVVTPSFARPQLFPDLRSTSFLNLYRFSSDVASPFYDMTRPGGTASQVMRPHRDHAYGVSEDLNSSGGLDPGEDLDGDGMVGPIRRYVVPAGGITARSGDRDRLIPPFDFLAGQPGIFGAVGQPIEFDVDADGDGVLDAIWIDLGHPIIDLPDGRQAVPLYYVKILDADGLINLNVHGNLGLVTSITHPVGNGNPASTSNMGLSRSEVSPLWALLANPGNPTYLDPADIPYALQEHAAFCSGLNPAVFYGGGTSDTLERLTTANMELTWLRIGRTQSTLGPNIAGLWGEETLLGGATAPAPGRTITAPAVPANVVAGDDNRDSNAHVAIVGVAGGSRPHGGYAYQDPFLAGLAVPPFVHPLDYRGTGRYLNTNAAFSPQGFKRLLQPGLLANNPSTFAQYYTADVTSVPPVPGWQEQVNTAAPAVFGIIPWRLGVNSAARPLQPDPFTTDQLLDDPDEVVLDGNFPSNVDAPFLPTEIAAFQLSDQHWKQTGDDSRARKLAPVNLVNNREAHNIRKQFTSESWDRREFSISPQVSLTGPAAWSRTWEFNDINAATGANRFPPLFTLIASAPQSSRLENVNAGVAWAMNPSIAPEDPFRPEIRRLLTMELNNTSNIASGRQFPRHRLNLNRLLADDSPPDRGAHAIGPNPVRAFDSAGNPQYRQLVPHADFTGSAPSGSAVPPMIHLHDAPTPYPFAMIATDPVAQEWWARFDRQRLARDIYVLLYTLCHNDSVNPTAAAATDIAIVREMAQFAVNYVDALDRDNVITRFAYDDNLSDGWNSTVNVVDGIEAQSLSFSEVLWARGDRSGSGANAAETIWDESMDAHDFLYIELRNATPFDVQIDDLDMWRIVRQDTPTAGMPVATNEAEVEFRVPTIAPTTPFIGPGENFLIACQDNSMTVTDGSGTVQNRSSDMYIQFDPAMTGSAAFQMVAPYNKDDADASLPMAASEHPERTADLDLSYTGPNEHVDGTDYEFSTRYDPTMLAPGTLVAVNDTETSVDFVLQRRRHLNAYGAISDADNEWIEVDRVTVTADVLNPDGGGFAAKVLELRSIERSQPFDPEERDYSLAPTSFRSHTLGDPLVANRHKANSELAQGAAGQPTTFSLWQPHFNRDFSSAMELLSLPLYGVRADTDASNWDVVHFGGPCANLSVAVGLQQFPRMTGLNATGDATAALARIRNPVGVDDGDPVTPNPLQNRWYRLFEFVEVPSRSESTLYDRLLLHRRTPGCINLNTVRHEAVLAGLIDDAQIRRFGDGTAGNEFDPGAGQYLTDDRYDGARNWFRMFLYARDGIDLFTNAPLPGVPGARPFRGLGYVDPQTADASIQHTILRGHAGVPLAIPVPTYTDPLAQFGLFEARSVTDFNAGTPEPVDFHTRNRLLAKIANNTTTRSHVFMIWAGYELFEAHQPAPEQFPNVVQIGARITDLPGRREFTVVDMTRLEEAYNPVTGAFDFRKFIIYRKRIK